MALIGGGGAGNVAGGNPSSTGTGLNYIGDHAYAYSGAIEVPQSTTTLLNFDTGTQYIKGILAIQNGSGSGDDMRYEISFNSQVVAKIYAGSGDIFNQFQFPINFVLPAYTRVLVTAYNISSGSGREHTATFTGRVYG
jgi:hypothetical protein